MAKKKTYWELHDFVKLEMIDIELFRTTEFGASSQLLNKSKKRYCKTKIITNCLLNHLIVASRVH